MAAPFTRHTYPKYKGVTKDEDSHPTASNEEGSWPTEEEIVMKVETRSSRSKKYKDKDKDKGRSHKEEKKTKKEDKKWKKKGEAKTSTPKVTPSPSRVEKSSEPVLQKEKVTIDANESSRLPIDIREEVTDLLSKETHQEDQTKNSTPPKKAIPAKSSVPIQTLDPLPTNPYYDV
ncbi:hypothetical protein R1sor_013841 [Riccia sorocarpa]|uniref:Uncharacterized protein n=1 Tax=Riccia sorocarpa TaxID=122646 RepID=A0ABD3HAC3_9MARC